MICTQQGEQVTLRQRWQRMYVLYWEQHNRRTFQWQAYKFSIEPFSFVSWAAINVPSNQSNPSHWTLFSDFWKKNCFVSNHAMNVFSLCVGVEWWMGESESKCLRLVHGETAPFFFLSRENPRSFQRKQKNQFTFMNIVNKQTCELKKS